MTDICFLSARELRAALGARDVSAREVVEAHLRRIERVNPEVNAVVTLVAEQALADAAAADERAARGAELPPLHGIPVAHKDTHETAGIRTTFGSPLHADYVPRRDELVIERMRAAGVITLGKTNVPEFAAGSHTFNPVFGATRNPYDPARSAGGSSGGAAAALACGMHPLADGSDLGGSLRNPASFCNVVGFRPSTGRVPSWPAPLGWTGLGTAGPMARTVADAALLLSVLAGPDPRSPIALDEPGEVFARPLDRDVRGLRVAWSPDLGGLPVEPEVAQVVEASARVLADLGCAVERACPDFSGADEAFRILRAWQFAVTFGPLLETSRDRLKESIVWNTEEGLRLSGTDVGRAEVLRTELFHRVREFFGRYDFLLLPVSQVPPFDAALEYPSRVAGVEMETYLDWMRSAYYVTVTGSPALSVPAGFTPGGLPVGLQIVGPHRADFAVLQLGHAFEQATQVAQKHPEVAV
ncbi:amidase [Amycolatopsis thermophila]|uniref:Amidase n=1 Tax=Amycolatopsis thermophila TaxID=206084 RepID=A0ABU0F466_9PSEU|nr:amidase [Amycolatopsis thermophila]MDQ0382288.1 amidase [Amycolatopsis thermophila]